MRKLLQFLLTVGIAQFLWAYGINPKPAIQYLFELGPIGWLATLLCVLACAFWVVSMMPEFED